MENKSTSMNYDYNEGMVKYQYDNTTWYQNTRIQHYERYEAYEDKVRIQQSQYCGQTRTQSQHSMLK